MIAVVAFSSCDNSEDALIVPCKEESFIHNKNLTRSTGIGTLRINPSQAVLGTSFQFTVWIPGSYPETRKAILCFESPSGDTYWFDMKSKGYDVEMAFFELTRSLSQCGEYKVSAYEKLNYYPYKTNLYSNETVTVLHPDIPFGDNYSSLNTGGMTYKNCTAWVTGKINEMWNSNSFQELVTPRPRHAKYWKDRLISKGYKADLNPRVGDIAWWEANVPGCSTSNGHVAFVNKVSSDGNTVYITEYNFPSGQHYGTRTLKRYGSTQNRENFPTAFIHVQTKRN